MRQFLFIIGSILALTGCPATVDQTPVEDDCTRFWRDADGDGFGDPSSEEACLEQTALPGYAPSNGDCDDSDSASHPGATEACDDAIDNDCDGVIDEDCTEASEECEDADGDGFCKPVFGVSDPDADCDDFDDAINPDADEDCANGVDDDCDGLIDSADPDCGTSTPAPTDADGDGHSAIVDCNDAEPSIHPGATERCNGVDDDCDGVIDEGCPGTTPGTVDADGDGYTSAIDCDDTDRNINPGATEVCNGKDDDCDGQTDEGCPGTTPTPTDADGDGHSASVDCDDTDRNINPGATEVCNGKDDDCDGQIDEGVTPTTWYRDADGDGYGDPVNKVQACQKPTDYVANSTDCNDTAPSVKPGGVEICNGVDDDCDGQIDEGVGTTWYRDADGDGYGTVHDTKVACAKPAGYVAQVGDCDDSLSTTRPGVAEVCNNGEDDDCNGLIDSADASVCAPYGDGVVQICIKTQPLKNAGMTTLWVYARTDANDSRWFINQYGNHPFVVGNTDVSATTNAELCSQPTPWDVAKYGLQGGTHLAAGDYTRFYLAGFCKPNVKFVEDNGKICGVATVADVIVIRGGNQRCGVVTAPHNGNNDYADWGSQAKSVECE